MLTKEIIAANELLAGLTPEQVEAITTLSQNDEKEVIDKKTRDIYDGLDADILMSSGVEKNGLEKTYDYAKRVIGSFKAAVDGAKGNTEKIKLLEQEREKLKAEIAKGGGEEMQRQLTQAQTDLKSVMDKYNTLKGDYDKAQSDFAKKLLNTRLDADFATAAKSVKIKSSIPTAAADLLLQQAFAKLKATNPEYVENADGTKSLVFKDSEGAVLRNPNNTLNPYTAAELLQKELSEMGILENRRGGGTGTGAPQNKAHEGIIDISGAKNQREAYDLIDKALLAQGLTVGSQSYQDALDKAWKDNEINKLPK